MMEKQLTPMLRFGEFEEVWKMNTLKNLGSYNGGGTPDTEKSEHWNGSIPWISSSDIIPDSIHKVQKTRFINQNAISSSATKLIPKGSILMVSRVGIGKFAVADEDLCTSQDFTNLTTKEDPFFLSYYFSIKSNRFISISQGTSIKGFTTKDLKLLKFPIPTLPEQQKIASFLTSVDTKIEQLNQKKALLEQYKKGMMQQIFSQKLRFKDKNGNDYQDWETVKLGDFSNLIHGDGDWILSKDISNNGDYQIVQLGNIGFGVFVEKKLKTISTDKFDELKGTLIHENDLLINRMVDGSLNCCIFKKRGKYITSVDVCWIRKNNFFDNYFLMSVILYGKNQNKLLNLSSGSGRVRISKKNLFNEFSFKLPSIEEQIQIANFLSSIDDKIEQVQTQIENTSTFKKGLLQQMFV